jgi:probable F420-dependent oxidoreductase
MLRFSCSLPIDRTVGFDTIAKIGSAARAIEAAGLDACFVTDHPAPSAEWLAAGGSHETIDPFVALTVAAAATTRLKLHTNIIVLPYRNPLLLAKSVASLDSLSGGRMILGASVGYHRPEFESLGVAFAERGALATEAIKVLRSAFTGEPVRFEGMHFSAVDAVVRPIPVQIPIPIWSGGNSSAAMRRAAELCDGWSPMPAGKEASSFAGTEEMSTLDQFKSKVQQIQELREDFGRHDHFDFVTAAFDMSNDLNHPGRFEASWLVDSYSRLAEAGATWGMCHVETPDPAKFEDNVRWFGEEVAAKVRQPSR